MTCDSGRYVQSNDVMSAVGKAATALFTVTTVALPIVRDAVVATVEDGELTGAGNVMALGDAGTAPFVMARCIAFASATVSATRIVRMTPTATAVVGSLMLGA